MLICLDIFGSANLATQSNCIFVFPVLQRLEQRILHQT